MEIELMSSLSLTELSEFDSMCSWDSWKVCACKSFCWLYGDISCVSGEGCRAYGCLL